MHSVASPLRTRSVLALGFVTFLLMLPETLPVPVLRGLVAARFEVGPDLASVFMAANMVGALAVAPFLPWFVARTGSRRRLALVALFADALLMQAMAHPVDYASFLCLRLCEGAAHITALALTMGLVADAAGSRRGSALGCLGAGLTLGVATGALIGGQIGKVDPLRTLHVASAVLGAAGLLAAWLLPADVPASDRPSTRALLAMWRTQPGVRAPLLVAFVERFTVGFFTTGFPLLLPSETPADRARIGMLLGAFLYPFALLSWPFGRAAEKWSRTALVAIGSGVYGLGVAVVGIVPIDALWVLMPVLGISSAVMFVPSLLWLLERAPGIDRTTAMAAFHGVGSLGFLLGPICCGQLIALGGAEGGAGYVLAFAVAGLTEIGAAALVLLGTRARR
ncbi:MAG: MFS transporter [Planctomycetes bacterium]|nr:MFS transporter [Planctomycetota bacterium]